MALGNEPSKTPVGGTNVFTNRGPRLTGLPARGDEDEQKDNNNVDDLQTDSELDPQEEIDDDNENVSNSDNEVQNMKNSTGNAKTAANLLKKNPKIKFALIGGAGILFLIFIIALLFMGLSGSEDEEENNENSKKDELEISYYYDPTYDFNGTIITLKNPINDQELDVVTLEDLLKGMVYAELHDKIKNLSEKDKLIVFQSTLVAAKSHALSIGKYNYEKKEFKVNSGSNGLNYCDIYYGCKILNQDGLIAFLPVTNATSNMNTGLIEEIKPMDNENREILDEAYRKTKYTLIVPKDVNDVIREFNYTIPYNSAIISGWINNAYLYDLYEEIVKDTVAYVDYKLYDLTEYIEKYDLSTNLAWWWPIGSAAADNENKYSGTPAESSISRGFGKTPDNVGSILYHDGIDIKTECNSNIIVAKAGVIDKIGYDEYKGHYVVIDHKDSTKTKSYYYHLDESSISVEEGKMVERGNLIGKLQKTHSDQSCHLHFSIYSGNSAVDPSKYVSIERPRANSVDVFIKYVAGVDNKQSICLTLKESGFSNNATAALLSNIYHESSYIPNNKGDWSGNIHTSYGLCQWHNSRKTRLLNHCRENYGNDAAVELGRNEHITLEMQQLQLRCQLDYLIYELKTSYVKRYQILLSNESAYKMGWDFCYNFEVPASRETKCVTRGNYATTLLHEYVTPQTANGTKGCGID